jgi:predicted phosphodiesterase
MSSIEDALANLKQASSADQYERAQRSAPKGWEVGIDRRNPNAIVVTTGPMPQLDEDTEWDEVVRQMMPVPDGYRVRLAEAKYDPAAWQRDAHGDDAVTRPVWRYRFLVEPHAAAIPLDDLVAQIAKWKPRKGDLPTGEMAFVLAPGDLQLGKIDGTGSAGTAERFQEKVSASVVRLKELRKTGRSVGEVVLALLGDCIEGYNSQGGRLAKRTDLTLTEMVRVYRRLVLWAIKELAPLAERVTVVAIPGNHDEAVRIGDMMGTTYDDSWAIEGVVAVQDALAESKDFGHVSFVYPKHDELTVTIDVAGTIVGFAHGHQFRGGWQKWWAGQAHGCQPIGDATLLLAGHLHHLNVQWPGTKTFIQVPALDGGSAWWRHKTGQDSPPGLVTLLVGQGRWQDLAVL